jgi:hypothetical protein
MQYDAQNPCSTSAVLLCKIISGMPGREFNFRAYLAEVRRANNLVIYVPPYYSKDSLDTVTLLQKYYVQINPTEILHPLHVPLRSKLTITPF